MSPIVQPPTDDARVKMTACLDTDQLRARWLALMRRELPDAARHHSEWPIRLDHCFGRVILDAVHGRPWREVLPAPAWRNMDEPTLRRAVALAEAILDGSADLPALNAASLCMRGKPNLPHRGRWRRAPEGASRKRDRA